MIKIIFACLAAGDVARRPGRVVNQDTAAAVDTTENTRSSPLQAAPMQWKRPAAAGGGGGEGGNQ